MPLDIRRKGGWKAKYWIIKDRSRGIIHGYRLNELVRTHAELFDQQYCLAQLLPA